MNLSVNTDQNKLQTFLYDVLFSSPDYYIWYKPFNWFYRNPSGGHVSETACPSLRACFFTQSRDCRPDEVFHGFHFWRARINQSDMIPLSEEMSSGWVCASFSCGQRIKRANIHVFFTDFPSESWGHPQWEREVSSRVNLTPTCHISLCRVKHSYERHSQLHHLSLCTHDHLVRQQRRW